MGLSDYRPKGAGGGGRGAELPIREGSVRDGVHFWGVRYMKCDRDFTC